MADKMKTGAGILLLWMTVLYLTGCNNTELEERNFPLAAAVDYADDKYQMAFGFEQLKDVADEKSEKENTSVIRAEGNNCMELFLHADGDNPGEMDYNHMKALILTQELVEEEAKLDTFLQYLEEENLISRNTLLFVTGNKPEEIMGMDEKIKEPAGTYLSERIASDERFKDSEAVTLGSLFKIWENQNENLWIPYVSCENGKIMLEEYYLMQGRNAAGSVSRETGELALLSEQKLKSYSIALGDAESVKLDHLDIQLSFAEEDGMVKEIVRIKSEAEFQGNKDILENAGMKEQLEKKIAKKMEQQMEKMTEKLQKDKHADGTNSYYKLGGYAREIYLKYQNDWSGYCRNLTVEYQWEITLFTAT